MTKGRCLCGAVEFTVATDYEYSGYCHCSGCRAASGSAFSAFAAVRKENLMVRKGLDDVRIFPRTKDNFSHFCRNCGSVLFAIVRDGEYAHVQLGVLVDDPGIRPSFHVFVGSKAPWFEITDELPQFRGLPEG
jgi:hypothetical protein